jgi:hypothetical protein
MNIAFQLNYPLEGVARRQGGVFVDDGNGVVLANRGIMTKEFRVERAPLLRQLGHRVIEVEDDGRASEVILIAPLESISLVQDLKEFGREAREAVTRVAEGLAAPLRGNAATTFMLPSGKLRDYFDEFFGQRRAGGGGSPGGGVAQCHHGAIVRALQEALTGKCVKSAQIDLALERPRELVLFEVKTSTSTQDVYTGLGQLLFHGEAERRPRHGVVRCLVLPQMPDPAAARRVTAAMDVRFVSYRRQANGTYRFEGLDRL